MTRFQYYVATSLDGRIADREGGLQWLLDVGMDEFMPRYDEFLADVGAIVMGRSTYEFLLAEDPTEWPYRVPSWVLTHADLPALPGADIRWSSGEVAALRGDLLAAAGDRNVWIVGGGGVAGQFAAAGMLDDLLVTVMPVVLGGGPALLEVEGLCPLELVDSTPFPRSGAIELAYRVVRPADDAGHGGDEGVP